jgi:carboxyl-terminal processing protease
MKRARNFWAVVILLVGIAFFLNDNIAASQARKSEEELYKQLQLFSDVLSIVKNNYVEPVESQKLIYGALKGMLSSLDPYSTFLEPEMYKELTIETEGKFGGVGMTITVKDGLLTVVSPIEDTPAYRAKLKPNDKIIRIDDKITKGMDSTDAVKLLRGEPGTKVTIDVLREGAPELIKVVLVREIIVLKSVKRAQFLPDSKIAYVRLVEFQKDTYPEMKDALETLKKQGMEGLIIDLRNNPGGLLDTAIDVSSLFLETGKLVTYTQGRKPEDRVEFKTKQDEVVPASVPIVVLINGGSASAAEILSGALSDWKRATLVGEKSFGKGSVQTVVPLPDNAAVKITIAHYYTPKGRIVEGKGLPPDVEVKQAEVKQKENDLSPEETPETKTNLDITKDNQLQAGFNLLKGKLAKTGK